MLLVRHVRFQGSWLPHLEMITQKKVKFEGFGCQIIWQGFLRQHLEAQKYDLYVLLACIKKACQFEEVHEQYMMKLTSWFSFTISVGVTVSKSLLSDCDNDLLLHIYHNPVQ